jgi:hypothetical protein
MQGLANDQGIRMKGGKTKLERMIATLQAINAARKELGNRQVAKLWVWREPKGLRASKSGYVAKMMETGMFAPGDLRRRKKKAVPAAGHMERLRQAAQRRRLEVGPEGVQNGVFERMGGVVFNMPPGGPVRVPVMEEPPEPRPGFFDEDFDER